MKFIRSNFRRILFLLIISCGLHFRLGAQVIYVTPAGAGTQSGSSWGNAAPGSQLQTKMDNAAANTQIWVAAGTYKPTAYPNGCSGCSTPRDQTFLMKSGVALYGGFAGNETAVSQRSLGNNHTILSGDIGIIGDASDNCYHIMIAVSCGAGTLVDGFTFMDGNTFASTNNAPNPSVAGYQIASYNAAGIYSVNSLLDISNSIFTGNTGTNVSCLQFISGATVQGDYKVSNCLFVSNVSNNNSSGCIIRFSNTNGSISGCTITNNSNPYCGVYCYLSNVNIANTIIWSSGPTSISAIYSGPYYVTTASNSIIDGGYPGAGNSSSNPLFVNAGDLDGPDNIWGTADDGAALSSTSPAINAGNNQALPPNTAYTLAGAARVQQTWVDIGAYESSYTACSPSAGTTIYVDSSIITSGNGDSWATAFKKFADALLAVKQCAGITAIQVAKGTYYPTSDMSRDSTFAILRGGLKIYGGYPSGGGTRDIKSNPTVLSGNIGSATSNTDNSYHVMVIAGLGSSADSVVIDGFTVCGGQADGSSGNIYNGASVYQSEGSGLYLHSNNGLGGKIAVRNCLFTANTSATYGGGFYNQLSSPTIANCIFSGNTALGNGGGGMFNYNSSSPCVTNCVFVSNAGYSGGGIYNYTSSSPLITNCTFSSNVSANGGAGLYNDNSASPQLNNCIIWGNTGPYPGIYNSSSASAIVKYSIVQGLSGGSGNLNADPVFANAADPDGTDNIFGTADDGLRLANCSPAINTGANAAIPQGITDDVTGAPRIAFTNTDMGAYEKQTASPANLADGAALSGASANSTPFIKTCDDGTWTYYAIPNNADSIGFAIAWNGNAAAKNAATVSVTTDAANTAQSTGTSGTWAMRRYWNVALNGTTISSPVNVRFYYAAADTLAMKLAATASGLSPVSKVKWFKTVGTPYSPALITASNINSPFVILTPAAGGIENNTAWVQFNGITSFSGGTAIVNAGTSAPLPVTLINFDAQKTNNDQAALLSWQVGSEHAVNSYEVEHATDAANFTVVGSTPATGKSNYAFTHSKPVSGENYYRLRMLDNDGRYQYSPVRKLVFSGNQYVEISPNPVHSELNITNTNTALNGTAVVIMDMSGRAMVQFVLQDKQVIETSQWPAGLYLIRLADGNFTKLQKL